MSLQVWLPLTKDLRNQGLDTITITTANTNVFQNEGKMGNKSLDVSGHYAFKVPSLVKKRVFSCSFWYKPVSDSSASDYWRRIIVFDTFTSDGSTTGTILRFESSYGYQSSNTSYCISIHNNVVASIGTGLGETDGWNKWQHIAITADGTTLKCYRNGVQVASGNMDNGGMLQGIVHIGYSGNRPIGRLNDFRIYDHCLSPMEVKELAKGLVLHYPLNRGGWGQENLYKFRSYADNWSMSKLDGVDYTDSSYGNVIKLTTSAADQRMFRGVASGVWQKDQVYTVSFLAKADTNGRTCDMSRSLADFSPTFTLTTDWKRYSGKITSTATPGGGSLAFRVNQSEATVYITQIKLEKGEIVTPYCPYKTEPEYNTFGLNSTTEYDCSGFGNNGTRTGTFTWTSDTPKYSISTKFNGAEKISANSLPLEVQSVSFWVKVSTIPSGYGICYVDSNTQTSIGFYNGNSFITSCAVSANVVLLGTTFKANEWNHIVLVKTGANTRNVYCNGILLTNSGTNAWVHNGSNLSLGWRDYASGNAGWFNGQLCDFRAYATALSADDVKSLYQNSAYIDSSGNVYGTIHES